MCGVIRIRYLITSHLKLNEELINVEKWTIDCIDERTNNLIEKIKSFTHTLLQVQI